jgi:hypothetical protein
MKAVLLGAIGCGLVSASLVLWMAFQDNNQGEFFEPRSGALVWGSVVPVFLASFVSVFVPVAVIGALLRWAFHKMRSGLAKS